MKRCRFSVWNGRRSTQCQHPAKGDRVIVFDTGETLPACGVHLRTRVSWPYRPAGAFYLPIEEEVKK